MTFQYRELHSVPWPGKWNSWIPWISSFSATRGNPTVEEHQGKTVPGPGSFSGSLFLHSWNFYFLHALADWDLPKVEASLCSPQIRRGPGLEYNFPRLWGIQFGQRLRYSLRSKRFQSSYCAKVRAEAKKGWRGRGRGEEETLARKPHDSGKRPLIFHGSVVNWQLVKIET